MKMLFYPLSKATTMRSGQCYIDTYWISHPQKGLLFVETHNTVVKQCNSDVRVLEHMLKQYDNYQELKIVKLNTFFGNEQTSDIKKLLVS